MDAEKLLEKAGNGDTEAFCAVVERFQAAVRGYVARFVLSSEDVFDLTQETFLAAFRNIRRYQAGRDVGAWLLGIARHRALNHLRTCARRARRERDFMAEAAHRWQAERLGNDHSVTESRLSLLRLCMEKLAKSASEMVRMKYVDRLSAKDMARRLGAKVGTVRMKLCRVRETLRECIDRHMRVAGEEHA
jgi:RNA polymerase sigma-70 factor (ECF subfamily)